MKKLYLIIFALSLTSCADEQNNDFLNGILFSGCDEGTGLPIVADAVVTSEDGNTMTLYSIVIESCGTTVAENGFCLSTGSLPTIDDSVLVSGAGIGYFGVMLEDLQQFVTYHARPYAINAKGVAYGSELVFQLTLQIGQAGPAGGIVFYDKGEYADGWRYLEAAPLSTEWEDLIWGCSGLSISTSTAIGHGIANSENIVSACPDPLTAAKACLDLTHNSYDDWFLPTIDELHLMWSTLYVSGLGGFSASSYWSSSEYTPTAGHGVRFDTGMAGQGDKTFSFRVRAIRRF